MAFSEILSGLGLYESQSRREEEERRRRRRHRSHRHGEDEYRSSHAHRRRHDDSERDDERRRSYTDGYKSSRRDTDYSTRRRSTVEPRGPRQPNNVAARAPVLKPVTEEGRRGRNDVSMRRTPSSSSSSGFDEKVTPPTTPGSGPTSKSLHTESRPEVYMRGGPQRRETGSGTEDDYARLRPGKRKLRTGERAVDGARGTDFMVGVPSDIGSLSSESDTEPEAPPADKGIHLKIVNKPAAADKMMTGALSPGDAPYRRIGPPTSRPLITRSVSKQSTGFLSQLTAPSSHHAKVKRGSTVSSRPKTRGALVASSPKPSSPTKTHATPAAPPAMLRRRATLHAVPASVDKAPTPPPELEPTVECLTCCDDIPVSKAAKLECGHVMCRSCLKRVFELSVTDPAHMPPKCCTEKHIPLKFVSSIFDNKFKVNWNKKFQEFSTQDRMYCPRKGCGEWIVPERIKLDKTVGRRYGTCEKCKTKVCKKCNMKWHGKSDCHNDEETKQLLDTAKEEGWQRCYSCKAMVQLAEGCNHMKCRCTAEFCMICGLKWKTCDCPWFNTPPENDPMGGIFFPPPNLFRPRFLMRDNPNGGPPIPYLDRNPLRNPPQRGEGGYAAQIAARRAQEQADEELARRLQIGDDMGPDPFQHQVGGAFNRDLGMDAGAGVFGIIADIARLAMDVQNDAHSTHRREYQLGRNTRVAAAWTRPRRRATVNERTRARAPEPPAANPIEAEGDPESDDDWGSDDDSYARRRRERRQQRRSSSGGRPPASAMAGLGRNGRQGRDRVGGWLEHIAGGGPNPFHYET